MKAGRAVSLESRMWRAWGQVATSMQSPPWSPLYEDFVQVNATSMQVEPESLCAMVLRAGG